MRYCILGDIHGNLPALEAVLKDAAEQSPEAYVCTGDIVGYGADPGACIEQLRGLGARCVAGNHDWAATGRVDTGYFNPDARRAVLWTAEALTADEEAFLDGLPLTLEIENAVVVHGSLTAPDSFPYILSGRDACEMLARQATPFGFIGHSHVPGAFVLDGQLRYDLIDEFVLGPDAMAIVNVGSVGQPRDGVPRAASVIYDSDARRVELRRVEYDWQETSRRILAAGLPMLNAVRLAMGQ